MMHEATFWAILPRNFVVWALSHWEWVTHLYLDTLDRSWGLCLTWILFDIAQKVARHRVSYHQIQLPKQTVGSTNGVSAEVKCGLSKKAARQCLETVII